MRFCLAVLASATLCALAQTGSDAVEQHVEARFGAPAPFYPRSVKTKAPYSADEVTQDIQTLADGTHITRTNASAKVYRDSAGRTRRDRPLFYGGGKAEGDTPQLIEIVDPVARLKYFLDVSNKVAHRQQLEVDTRQWSKAPGSEKPIEETRPQTSTEQLGTQTIEGLAAEGSRFSTTYPIGSKDNDRPFTVAFETWISRELGVVVLSKNTDPRRGEHTQKLVNISLAEPSASLFQVPADYTVVDEAGAFTISH